MNGATLKSRYEKFADADRRPYLDRARTCAKLTIPSLIPDEGHNKTQTFTTPWQSIGAKGTNNLASKMLLSLFAPGTNYFRLKVSEADLQELGATTKGEVEKGLAAYERVIMGEIENSKTRSSLFNAFKHLNVSGNALVYEEPDTGHVRMYPLSRYVVKRTPGGHVYLIITLDVTTWGSLEPDLKALLTQAGVAEGMTEDKPVNIYTGVQMVDNKWIVWQEVEGVMVPDSQTTFPQDSSPYIPLRFSSVEGEDYGRGMIEELYGDLNTYDSLQQAIAEGSAIASLVKFLVDPNGSTEVDDLADCPNGGFATGREQDISVLQVQKFGDLRVAREYLVELKADLQSAFLMHQSIQRNAERVTAEEIRFMAQELEDALGGIYSLLAQEMQLPLVRSTIRRLTKNRMLAPLPKQVRPEIITGLEALGRNQEHQRLRLFAADTAQMFGPEAVAEYLSVDEYMKRSAAAMNIPTDGLVRSDDEVQQRRQQQLEAQAQAQAAARQPQQ